MKTPTMLELQLKIREIELDLKNNWSAWGDVGDYVRKKTINKLAFVRRALGKPTRIELRRR